MPLPHFSGGNLWLLKTTSQNRGRGIHVFKTMKQLRSLIKLEVGQHTNKSFDNTLKQNSIIAAKPFNFVIQKYIERPLLINNRKFDIRVWVLVNQDMEVYFFREGYLRTSSSEYKADDVDNAYIHLTNNAVQKNGLGYGRFEDGNQLSFKDLQRTL